MNQAMTNAITEPEAKLNRAFQAQRNAFRSNPYPSAEERIIYLQKLEQLLLDNQDDIAQAVSADYGNRAIQETKLAEVYGVIEEIRYSCKRLKKWMKPQKRHVALTQFGAKNRVIPQPKGVIAVVTPWNYPLFLSMGPVVSALSAGNRVIVKMAANSQRLCELLDKLVRTSFPEEVLCFVPGISASSFTQLPYDHLIFTGSAQVGKTVMATAAQFLTPVTLELGGKSPTIVADDFDLNTAAKRVLYSKAFNAGQTCVAPDYLFLPTGKVEAFVEHAKAIVPSWYKQLSTKDYTAIIDKKAYQRLQLTLKDAVSKGATLVPLLDQHHDDALNKIAPTLVLNVSDDMLIMQEEIFGPLFPIKTYDGIEQVIHYINDRDRPLALYLFSNNKQLQQLVIENTLSGGVGLNECALHVAQPDLPFGGIGNSGMGQYHAFEGFLEFSKLRPIFTQSKNPAIAKMLPPYGEQFDKLYNFMLSFKL